MSNERTFPSWPPNQSWFPNYVDPWLDRKSLNKLPKPTFIRTAKERNQMDSSRRYIRACLRILKQHTGHLPYTESAIQMLIDEYEMLSDLITQYDKNPPELQKERPDAELFSVLSLLADLPELLIKQRLARRLSQSAVADQAGIGRSCYNNYERTLFADAPLNKLVSIAKIVCATAGAPENQPTK